MNTPADPVEMKRVQREQWSLAAAAWNRWWGIFEKGAQGLNEELCEMAQLQPGQRVLDLASGLGEPSFTAARRVGERGEVVGIDLAPGMVAFAHERALERGCSNVRFEEGDGEDLDVSPGSFDAALSRWGLMLMTDPVRAARSVHRALKSGGLFAAAVWSTADEVPFIAVSQRVVERVLDIPRPDPDAPGPMRMGEAGTLERCLSASGFEVVESRKVSLTIRFASTDEFVSFQREMSGMLKRALESASAQAQERLWKALADAAQPFVDDSGTVRFENHCHLSVGRA